MEENVRELIDEIIGKVRGNDGVSPTVSVSSIEGGYRITITDATHPDGQHVDVLDGKDGTSPTITIANITGGYRITITDVLHPEGQSIEVMHGSKGDKGDKGDSYMLTTADKQEIAGIVLNGLPTWAGGSY